MEGFVVPTKIGVRTGDLNGNPVVILSLSVVVPDNPDIGEQDAVIVFHPDDAVPLSADLLAAVEHLKKNPSPIEVAEAAGEESN